MSANNENFSDSLARHMDGTPRLYHGTDEEFSPGDIIYPANKVGKTASASGKHAYASPELPVAKFMAWERNNYNGKNFDSENYGSDNPPAENVYEVEPVNPQEKLKVDTGGFGSIYTPDWQGSSGGAKRSTEVLSTGGFKVLSKVQHPQTIVNSMRHLANQKEGEGYGAEGVLLDHALKHSGTETGDIAQRAYLKHSKQRKKQRNSQGLM